MSPDCAHIDDPVVAGDAAVSPVSREGPDPQTAVLTRCSPTLRTTVSRPSMLTVAVHLRGDLDGQSAPQLQNMLAPRLVSTIRTLVLDLSGLTFLGVAGLELLVRTSRHTHTLGIALRLVTGRRRCVERALQAGALHGVLPCSPDLETALADMPRPGRDMTRDGQRRRESSVS